MNREYYYDVDCINNHTNWHVKRIQEEWLDIVVVDVKDCQPSPDRRDKYFYRLSKEADHEYIEGVARSV